MYYNLTTKEGRNRLRAECQSELDAVKTGTWPRNLNDAMRWMYRPRGVTPAEHAGAMCQSMLDSLDTLERRTAVEDRSVVC